MAMHDEIAKSNQKSNLEIKTYMDRTYGPAWHCVVGKGFGSAVSYLNKHFIFLYISNKAILLFKYWNRNLKDSNDPSLLD